MRMTQFSRSPWTLPRDLLKILDSPQLKWISKSSGWLALYRKGLRMCGGGGVAWVMSDMWAFAIHPTSARTRQQRESEPCRAAINFEAGASDHGGTHCYYCYIKLEVLIFFIIPASGLTISDPVTHPLQQRIQLQGPSWIETARDPRNAIKPPKRQRLESHRIWK